LFFTDENVLLGLTTCIVARKMIAVIFHIVYLCDILHSNS
jgi:hypothetical protein